MSDTKTWLYVVTPEGADRPCKVGRSFNPKQRARNMSTGSPVPLAVRFMAPVAGPQPKWGSSRPFWEVMQFAAFVEKRAHLKLGGRRRKSEWFDVPLDEAIAAVNGAVRENRFAA